MQLKLFVFLAFLAVCHVSYCDTVTAGPVTAPNDMEKMIQQFQQGLTATIDTIRASLGQALSADAALNITNSLINNTAMNAQQVQEVVQKTFQMLQTNLQSTVDNVKLPEIPVAQVGDAVVKTAEMFPTALKKAFSFLENFSHGTNNQAATVEPAPSKK